MEEESCAAYFLFSFFFPSEYFIFFIVISLIRRQMTVHTTSILRRYLKIQIQSQYLPRVVPETTFIKMAQKNVGSLTWKRLSTIDIKNIPLYFSGKMLGFRRHHLESASGHIGLKHSNKTKSLLQFTYKHLLYIPPLLIREGYKEEWLESVRLSHLVKLAQTPRWGCCWVNPSSSSLPPLSPSLPISSILHFPPSAPLDGNICDGDICWTVWQEGWKWKWRNCRCLVWFVCTMHCSPREDTSRAQGWINRFW